MEKILTNIVKEKGVTKIITTYKFDLEYRQKEFLFKNIHKEIKNRKILKWTKEQRREDDGRVYITLMADARTSRGGYIVESFTGKLTRYNTIVNSVRGGIFLWRTNLRLE